MESKVRIEFHPEATAELEVSAEWSADRDATVSRSFCLAVDGAIEGLRTDPERFQLIDGRHRVCSVKRFPFQIVFRCEESCIYVVAVAHAKRRPGYWRER